MRHEVRLREAVRHRAELERRSESGRVFQLPTSVKAKPKLTSQLPTTTASIVGGFSAHHVGGGQRFPSVQFPSSVPFIFLPPYDNLYTPASGKQIKQNIKLKSKKYNN